MFFSKKSEVTTAIFSMTVFWYIRMTNPLIVLIFSVVVLIFLTELQYFCTNLSFHQLPDKF